MDSNLTHYYLNQIGITPWISKKKYDNLTVNLSGVNPSLTKMVVLVSDCLSDRAEILLTRILRYIQINEQDLKQIKLHALDSNDRGTTLWRETLSNFFPKVLLVFGFNQESLSEQLDLKYPVVFCPDVDYLLNNPKDKRAVFNDLIYVNHLLNVDSTVLMNT